MDMMGRKARDVITGFEGVVAARTVYISGCNQLLLIPPVGEKGEKREGEWFDEQRCVAVGSDVITLDNGMTPGPDREAPKR